MRGPPSPTRGFGIEGFLEIGGEIDEPVAELADDVLGEGLPGPHASRCATGRAWPTRNTSRPRAPSTCPVIVLPAGEHSAVTGAGDRLGVDGV